MVMLNKKKCLLCKHYYVTWDSDFPKGCLFFQLKSKQWPIDLVKKYSGDECQGFTDKNKLLSSTVKNVFSE